MSEYEDASASCDGCAEEMRHIHGLLPQQYLGWQDCTKHINVLLSETRKKTKKISEFFPETMEGPVLPIADRVRNREYIKRPHQTTGNNNSKKGQ
jgi:hypothetical protein